MRARSNHAACSIAAKKGGAKPTAAQPERGRSPLPEAPAPFVEFAENANGKSCRSTAGADVNAFA
jgi:hypothetical protein